MVLVSLKRAAAAKSANEPEDTAQDAAVLPVPKHVAIIMDGNGRWARARGLPRTAGHKRGVETVRASVKSAKKQGIKFLTLYGFSSENWSRPEQEVSDLMGLLRLYLRQEVKFLKKNGVRFQVIGNRARLSEEIQRLIENMELETAHNTDLTLTIALSYGGRDELANAARELAREAVAGTIDPNAIDEDVLASKLFTAGLPDPDLMIRTSGEKRISNFLPWQLAYTEFVFLDCHWPDFDHDTFVQSVEEFRRRDRRYGLTGD